MKILDLKEKSFKNLVKLKMVKNQNKLANRTICTAFHQSMVKGYFRRGEALIALNEHDLAVRDFEKVLELDADNKAAKNKVAMCVRKIKANKQKEKKTFANMFDKVSVIHSAFIQQ